MIRITDLRSLICNSQTPIVEALKKLTASERLFQIVVDEDGRLLGTLTDSDVRRAIIRGTAVTSAVSGCMQKEPVTGRIGDDRVNREKLARIPGLIAFLPLLDGINQVREIWLAEFAPRRMPALVMAGGAGRRLGALTAQTPKPLLLVGGRPILDHVLERLENSGIQKIFVSAHYLADQIEKFIVERDNRAQVELVREAEPLGTAGAIGNLPRDEECNLLVVNGDLMTRSDFGALNTFHDRHGYEATITVATYNIDIPFGVVHHNPDGIFSGIDEKPRRTCFVAAGMYLLSPGVTALVPPNERMDMPELLNKARNIGLKVGLFPVHEYWRDVGQPDDLAAVSRDHEANRV